MSGATSPTAPLILTVDELRATARVEDLVLPAFVTDDDPVDEQIDLVALRGLVARGLVALAGREADDGIRLDDELVALLGPTRGARVLVEVDEEQGGGAPSTWAALGGDAGPTTLFVEHGPGLVAVELSPERVAEMVARRCPLDDVVDEPVGTGFTVALDAQATADEAVVDGDPDQGRQILIAAGVPPDLTEAWIEAVTGRRRATAVQLARNIGADSDGPFEATELHWLVTAEGTAWLLSSDLTDLEPADPDADDIDDADVLPDDDFDSETAGISVRLAPIGRRDLIEALDDALAPLAVASTLGER